MESRSEISELQQLVCSDAENDDSTIQDDTTVNESKIASPLRSSKVQLIDFMFEQYFN